MLRLLCQLLSVREGPLFLRTLNEMAENGAGLELPQRRVGAKEQQNGKFEKEALLVAERKQRDREERLELLLWKKPLLTLHYFLLETLLTLKEWICKLWQQRATALAVILGLVLFSFAYSIEGAHQKYVQYLEKKFLWCAYWVGLGILSSVGLGTGLHTFLLYLGPHIASVTLAAYECGSVNFPEPPYPDQIICPQEEAVEGSISLWTIISKVRLEACMWGAGTAIGELPPYFMARAARLSGAEPDDEDYEEFEEMLEQAENAQALRRGCTTVRSGESKHLHKIVPGFCWYMHKQLLFGTFFSSLVLNGLTKLIFLFFNSIEEIQSKWLKKGS